VASAVVLLFPPRYRLVDLERCLCLRLLKFRVAKTILASLVSTPLNANYIHENRSCMICQYLLYRPLTLPCWVVMRKCLLVAEVGRQIFVSEGYIPPKCKVKCPLFSINYITTFIFTQKDCCISAMDKQLTLVAGVDNLSLVSDVLLQRQTECPRFKLKR
jgi:hypothetical protein